MEVLIILVLIILFITFLSWVTQAEEKSNTSSAHTSTKSTHEQKSSSEVISTSDDDDDLLKMRVIPSTVTLEDGNEVKVLKVEIKGLIVAPRNNTHAKITLNAFDCTGKSDDKYDDFILTNSKSYSSEEVSSLFETVDDDFLVDYEYTSLVDWYTAFIIPRDVLIYPYGGLRDIKYVLFIKELNSGNSFAFAQYVRKEFVDMIGYKEEAKEYVKAVRRALIIASLFVKSSNVSVVEVRPIMIELIKGAESRMDDEKDMNNVKFSLRQVMNKHLKFEYDNISVSAFIREAQKMNYSLNKADKYVIIEFFLKIVGCIEKVPPMHIEALNAIAEVLAIDEQEFQKAKHKYLDMGEISGVDAWEKLGIPSNLTSGEKKTKLLELYRKWNALTSHRDIKIREKANIMVDIIAECQQTLK